MIHREVHYLCFNSCGVKSRIRSAICVHMPKTIVILVIDFVNFLLTDVILLKMYIFCGDDIFHM